MTYWNSPRAPEEKSNAILFERDNGLSDFPGFCGVQIYRSPVIFENDSLWNSGMKSNYSKLILAVWLICVMSTWLATTWTARSVSAFRSFEEEVCGVENPVPLMAIGPSNDSKSR